MFRIEKQPFGKCSLLKLCNEATGEFISVNPQFGGALHQIGLQKENTIIEILDAYSSNEERIKDFATTYRGAKLFPFPNMVNKGKFVFAGKNYQLPLNWEEDGHAIHGFVADKCFEIVQENVSAEYASVTLSFQYEGEHAGYPFPFHLSITYSLHKDSEFVCTTTVQNWGKTKLPLGDGWHPYFSLSSSVDDLYVKVPAEIIIDIDEQFIPTGNLTATKEFLDFTPIGSRHFDTCFGINQSQPKAVSQLHCKQKDITISLWQETGKGKYNYLLLYTTPDRKSIAMEPMTCWPDAFNNEKDLIVLEPDETTEASFGIKIS